MRTVRIAGALILGVALLLVGQVEAEWQYTDAKGKTRTVVLKMDVPGEYRNTAVYVDPGNLNRAPAAVAPVPLEAPVVVAPVGPVAPGTKWWTLPQGSPERAAAKLAAEQTAAGLRNHATEAGVGVTAEAVEFNRVSGICRKGLDVMVRPDGTMSTYGSAKERFNYERCMQQQGQPIIWEKK
jgi:hypothetical protein